MGGCLDSDVEERGMVCHGDVFRRWSGSPVICGGDVEVKIGKPMLMAELLTFVGDALEMGCRYFDSFGLGKVQSEHLQDRERPLDLQADFVFTSVKEDVDYVSASDYRWPLKIF